MSSRGAMKKLGGFALPVLTNGRRLSTQEQQEGVAPKRKSHEQFVAELYSVNPKIQLCGNYVVSTKKVECRCLICQHEWTAFPGNLLKGKGCPACARKRGKKE